MGGPKGAGAWRQPRDIWSGIQRGGTTVESVPRAGTETVPNVEI